MNVVFLCPHYPSEMANYVRGLAEVGARVFGVGDAPTAALPAEVKRYLTGYLHVPRILDEGDVLQRVVAWVGNTPIDRVEAQWEPVVILAARIREAVGAVGMSLDTVRGFRDKELMKERIRAAGLRVPHSARVTDDAQAWKAAEAIGYPLILKPIAGAGSADTYRVNDARELATVLAKTAHVPEVSIEEFVEGEEYTYDTVCIEGRPAYENVAQYLPRPLIARQNEWISPVICTIRDLNQPHLRDGIALGRRVLTALGMGTGFTHMEWYRKSDGDVVFGEIGCRPGGAHLVDQMNLTSDIDLFREWARAVCWREVQIHHPRRYNAAIVFKRALGQGRITHIDGLYTFLRDYGEYVCWENLLKPGQHRRDWLRTLVSDGFVIVRHPEWGAALHIADQVARNVTLYAE
ncbi:MAG: biotin carboxylase [Myxococcota bacterium]|jgi:biotin carboxylase